MSNNLFGIHESALKLSAYRSELLANNIANADTPNFKARDVDFKSALAAAQAGQNANLDLAQTTSNHMALNRLTPMVEDKYRIPLQPSLDGNTVELQIEQAKFTENTLNYQASLNSINQTIRSIRNALSKE